MNNENICEIDRVFVRVLASIHPTNFSRLRARLLSVLSGTTGIDPNHVALAPLSMARTIDDLACVEWESMSAAVALQSRLSEQTLLAIFAHLRLFTERAVLHICLYRSISTSTLWTLDTWSIPRHGWPEELAACYGEFGQTCREADEALQQGRACLHAFEHALTRQRALSKPQGLLKRANASYACYLQALLKADQLAGAIREYIAETQEVAIVPDEEMQQEGRRAAA